nr:VOC family protein [Streptomyces sp. N35]
MSSITQGTQAPGAGQVKQVQVTFDCTAPERLARFWCEVLGYVDFQRVPEGNEFCLD